MTTASSPQSTAAQGHAAHTRADHRQEGLPGTFQRAVKVTMLGAGSHFTHPLMNDILSIGGAERGEVALVDTDERRLKPMAQIVQRLIEHYGKADGWTVTATTDRAEALPGTDYLINSIDVAGVDCVRHDNDIPLKYGIDQCIGDTIGPGGLFKALRTVPVWLDILRDAERLCPQAIVLNYTNPMSILCLAAGRAVPAMPVIGLCHSVQLTSKKLARDAEVPYEELTWKCAGINHLAWFTQLEHGGKDLYPTLFEKVRDRAGEVYESDPVRYDMMLHFGAFITESSGHLSEYLPYYRKTDETRQTYCRDGYRGGSSFYADNWPDWRKAQDEKRDRILSGEEELARLRTHEYAAWIIEGREKDTPVRVHGNVMNRAGDGGGGQLITNLPADGCVEVACMIDRTGINPTRFGMLPRQMAAVCDWNMRTFDLAAEACIHKSKEAAIHALLLDPLSAAVCTPAEIKQMALEMFEAERDYLPGYE
ncbi:MAG: alpha-glucosidase/alpha-galactosidase [Phycisphaeraceae bacterium]